MASLADLRSVASVPQGEGIPRRMSRFTEQVHATVEDLKTITGTSYITAITPDVGLNVTGSTLSTVIAASGGLQADASGFGIKLDGASLSLGASGLSVTTPATNYITAVDSNEGLEVNAGSLGTVINASGGLEVGASGFGVKLDGASLSSGASGLSVRSKYRGEMYVTSSASTTIVASDTYYKAAGTTTSANLNGFTMPSNNRLTYTGTPTIYALVQVMGGAHAAGSSVRQNTRCAIAKNGSVISATSSISSMISSHEEAFNCGGLVSLATNDYLELFVSNTTGTIDFAATTFSLTAIEIG